MTALLQLVEAAETALKRCSANWTHESSALALARTLSAIDAAVPINHVYSQQARINAKKINEGTYIQAANAMDGLKGILTAVKEDVVSGRLNAPMIRTNEAIAELHILIAHAGRVREELLQTRELETGRTRRRLWIDKCTQQLRERFGTRVAGNFHNITVWIPQKFRCIEDFDKSIRQHVQFLEALRDDVQADPAYYSNKSKQETEELASGARRWTDSLSTIADRNTQVGDSMSAQPQVSRTVLERAEKTLLDAWQSPAKRIVLDGNTMDGDPQVAALNLEAAQYCYRAGLARPGDSDDVFILTHSGIEYATNLQRNLRERAIQSAVFKILEEAEKSKWEIHWIEHNHGSIVQVNNRPLAETADEQAIFHEACYRMLHESGLIISVSGVLYRVTEQGRNVLYKRSDVPVLTGEVSPVSGGRNLDPKKVFVVHGRDEAARKDVELVLHKMGLEPIVLFAETSGGKTVIEKFEHYADTCGYAVVLITPEDIGYLKPEYNSGSKGADEERARQNVIFELGYFFGKLGRGKVAALMSGHVTKPSDIDGIVYISLSGTWMHTLGKEMLAAGLRVDLSKI